MNHIGSRSRVDVIRRVQIEIDARFFQCGCRCQSSAGLLSSNQPHIESEICAAASSLSLIKNISTRLRLMCIKEGFPAAHTTRFISLCVGDSFYCQQIAAAADRKSHPSSSAPRYLWLDGRQWNLLPLGLLGGGTQ